jgi:hypothetical protein
MILRTRYSARSPRRPGEDQSYRRAGISVGVIRPSGSGPVSGNASTTASGTCGFCKGSAQWCTPSIADRRVGRSQRKAARPRFRERDFAPKRLGQSSFVATISPDRRTVTWLAMISISLVANLLRYACSGVLKSRESPFGGGVCPNIRAPSHESRARTAQHFLFSIDMMSGFDYH